MSLTYVNAPGALPYVQRVLAGSYSLEVLLVGVLGSFAGVFAGSLLVAWAFAAVAVVAGIPVVRIWRTPDVMDALGGSPRPRGETGPHMLRRPWGLRLPSVPAARVQKDVVFATPPGSARPLLCDLWEPPVGVPSSGLAFIYLHGSAWMVLDKDLGTRPLFGRLAAQGHVIMDVAYRLYPETDIEGMVADVRRSIAWMKAHGEALGVKRDCIVVGGGSAGAHLALLAAYTEGHPELTPPDLYCTSADGRERRRTDTSVRGVLAWYGPVDLRACYVHFHNDAMAAKQPEQPDWDAPPSSLVRWMGPIARRLGFQKFGNTGRLDWILEGSPEQVPERYALLSPSAHVHADCPPTLLMQGTMDIIVPKSAAEALRDKMRQEGAQMALLLLPGIDHAFDLFGTRWSPSARKSIWHAERFLALMARSPAVSKPRGRPWSGLGGRRARPRAAK
jgi:acetyl esterase/lipase